jgi:hypothetical protein
VAKKASNSRISPSSNRTASARQRVAIGRFELCKQLSDHRHHHVREPLLAGGMVGVEDIERVLRRLVGKRGEMFGVDAADLGQPEEIGKAFAGFQKYLYARRVA